jgi:hypothetical protein
MHVLITSDMDVVLFTGGNMNSSREQREQWEQWEQNTELGKTTQNNPHTTQKTKMMSSTDLTRISGVNPCLRKVGSSCF